MGWVGFQKSYVILWMGHGKCLRPITRWVGGVKKGQNHAYVIFEWSLIIIYKQKMECIFAHPSLSIFEWCAFTIKGKKLTNK